MPVYPFRTEATSYRFLIAPKFKEIPGFLHIQDHELLIPVDHTN